MVQRKIIQSFLFLLLPLTLVSENITVIGIGRLGLCLALHLEKAGFSVLGVDLSPEYIAQINQKQFSSFEPGVTEMLQSSKHFRATTSLEEGLCFSDLCFLVVPTNSSKSGEPYDDRILSHLLEQINALRVENKHFVICSTLQPGYIKEKARRLIQNCPNSVISYKPELIAQGIILQGLSSPDLILIGEGNSEAGDLLEQIYLKACSNAPYVARMSVESAEIAKLALNCFVTAKIAFANLIADLADEIPGADKEAILQAIGQDQRIGSKALKPGYGFGGPCFPRDNRTLAACADQIGIQPLLLRAIDEVNALHANYQAEKLLQTGTEPFLFEDVCYKSKCPVPIIEESPKLQIARYLADRGKKVVIADRIEVLAKVQEEYGDLFEYVEREL